MSGVSAWAGMYKQSCTIAPPTGKDSFNVPTYGTAVTYKCRLVGKRRLVLAANGREVVSGMTVYLQSADLVSPESRVTLSTGDVGSTESGALTPKILSVGRFPDENGWHHSVLYL